MDELVTRALRLWHDPVPEGDAGLTAFRNVYIDPVRVNGVETPLRVLVDRARMMQAAIDGLTAHIDDQVVASGRRAFAFHILGRHAGPLVTPLGTVAASGRSVDLAGVDIFDVDEATERVTGVWAVSDYLGLLASLDTVALVAGPSAADDDMPLPGARLARATGDDAAELLVLQRCCWVDEALANETFEIAALHESLDDVRAWIDGWSTWGLRVDGRLVGAVRARREGRTWEIGRLMVAPDLAGRGIGRWLLRHAELQAPADVDSLVLFTGARSTRNLAMYERAGYVRTNDAAPPGAVVLTKRQTAPGADQGAVGSR